MDLLDQSGAFGVSGVYCYLALGYMVVAPAPYNIVQAIEQIEVTQPDTDHASFSIQFTAGRTGLLGLVDYPLLQNPLLQVGNRVMITVQINGLPRTLMDGLITDITLQPTDDAAGDKIIITGKDIGLAMDLKEKQAPNTEQPAIMIAERIIAQYAEYDLIPTIIPPLLEDVPDLETQNCITDYAFLTELAARYGYIFYVAAGPIPYTNIAYWGPPLRVNPLQQSLIAVKGMGRNIDSINFKYNGLIATSVSGEMEDADSDEPLPVDALISTRIPLSTGAVFSRPPLRQIQPRQTGGLSYSQAETRAQGLVNLSTDKVVTANGQLDTIRYGDVLRVRELVTVSGVGLSFDGLYYTNDVTHTLRAGQYTQSFSLTRDGTNSLF